VGHGGGLVGVVRIMPVSKGPDAECVARGGKKVLGCVRSSIKAGFIYYTEVGLIFGLCFNGIAVLRAGVVGPGELNFVAGEGCGRKISGRIIPEKVLGRSRIRGGCIAKNRGDFELPVFIKPWP